VRGGRDRRQRSFLHLFFVSFRRSNAIPLSNTEHGGALAPPERGYLSDGGSGSTATDPQHIKRLGGWRVAAALAVPQRRIHNISSASVDGALRQRWLCHSDGAGTVRAPTDGLTGGLVFFSFYSFINGDGHLDCLGKLRIY